MSSSYQQSDQQRQQMMSMAAAAAASMGGVGGGGGNSDGLPPPPPLPTRGGWVNNNAEFTREMRIPQRAVGKAIGRGGETIKRLKDELSTFIQVGVEGHNGGDDSGGGSRRIFRLTRLLPIKVLALSKSVVLLLILLRYFSLSLSCPPIQCFRLRYLI